MKLPQVKDVAPVEFTIKIDGAQLSLQKKVYPNAVDIEKKLRELMKLFHPDLVCSFCAELVSDGEKFELEGFGEFKEYEIIQKGRKMPMFRKKPEVFEALQFTGNDKEIKDFCPAGYDPKDTKPNLIIRTRKGDRMVFLNDWVIKGIEGDFYPCPLSVFEATYEAI